MKKIITSLVVIGTLLSGAVVASANHSWGGYHWARSANPFSLTVGDSMTPAWSSYLGTALTEWDQSPELALVKEPGQNVQKQKICKAIVGHIEVCNAKYGNNGWLGIAQVWASGSHITQATARMNDTYFSMAQYNTPAWKQLVVCQEVAHDFGLDHQDEVSTNANLGTCMDYTNDPDGGVGGASATDPSNEHPNAHDYEELSIIYAHLDSVLNLFSTKGTSGASTADTPSEWGRAVAKDATGRDNTFERNLGQGQSIVTHVFWAE